MTLRKDDIEQAWKAPLIGKSIKVVESKNKDCVGIEGKVLRETKNTIVVDGEQGQKTLMKASVTFVVDNITITGNQITKRIEDKPKLKIKNGKKERN